MMSFRTGIVPFATLLNSHKRKLIVDFFVGQTAGKWHPWIIFSAAFIDSSFFPLPVSTLFIMLIAINPTKYKEFTICAVSGVLAGALTTYTIGYYLWTNSEGELSESAIFITSQIPGLSFAGLSVISEKFYKWGFLFLAGGAFTFLPYGLFSLFSGISGMNVFIFMLATLAGHGTKFLILTGSTLGLSRVVVKAYNLLIIKVKNKYIKC